MKPKYYLIFGFLVLVLVFIFFDFSKKEKIILAPVVTPKSVSILNFGDVMFDRGVRNIIENRGRDPFEYIKKDIDTLKKFDVVVANLEGPIVEMDRSLCQEKAYNFQFSSNTPEILKSIDVNMVSIANNHSYDCYKVGFDSTKSYLEKAGIDYMGDSEVEKSFVIKEVNGKKVAFVGIDETVQAIPVSKFYPLIERLSSENDFVVVNIHWGKEYELLESETQNGIAHQLIDRGADVIFGHHPHVIQPIEIYKNKAIFYSLGNFVFDQNFGDTTTGLGAGVEFKDGEAFFSLHPFKMRLFAPDFLKDAEKEKFCESFLKDLKREGCSFKL
jgi:poly-gamma-glutamate synthesis protein (capsule biosynthesis protein)